jgi:hypothetical protein
MCPPSAAVRHRRMARLQLLIAEAGLIAFQEVVALRTEDVGHLHGGPAHGFWGRRKARRLVTSE